MARCKNKKGCTVRCNKKDKDGNRVVNIKGKRGRVGPRGLRGPQGPRGFGGKDGCGPQGRAGVDGVDSCEIPTGPVQIIMVSGTGMSDPIDVEIFGTQVISEPISGGTTTHSMDDGSCVGQLKQINTSGPASAVVAHRIIPDNLTGGDEVSLDSTDGLVTLRWDGSSWVIIELVGGTIIV